MNRKIDLIELIIDIKRPSLIKEIPSQSGHCLLNESASSRMEARSTQGWLIE